MAEKGSGKDKAKTAAKVRPRARPRARIKKRPRRRSKPAAKGAEKSSPPPALKGTPRLMEFYRDECVPQMMQEFRYKSPMQVPRLKKVVVNIGLGEAIQNIKLLESASAELTAVTGQKPVVTRAKKSIAAFKLREGMPIGCMVTLRREPHVLLSRQADERGAAPGAGLPGGEREGL